MNKELKPCPFCGGEAKIYNFIDTRYGNSIKCYVECTNCKGSTRTFEDEKNNFDYMHHAIEMWSARTVTPDIVDKISQELQNAGFEDASKWLDCKYEL